MILIPDTNVFYDDYGLKGTSLRILFEYLSNTDFKIILPEVVLLEVVNQVREKLIAVADANNNRVRGLKDKTGIEFSSIIYQTDIDKSINEYESWFRDRLESVGARIIEIPSVPHKTVVERDLNRKKPFTKNGKGYRDYLIWETVLQIASSNSEDVIFITENSNDFSNDEKTKLHPDLYSDLFSHKLDFSKVSFYPSLRSFLRDKFIPTLSPPKQTFVTYLEKNNAYQDFEISLAELLSEKLHGEELNNYIFGNDEIYDSITFSMLEYAYDIDVLDEYEVSSDERIIELKVYADCEFDSFIYKSDLYCMDVNDWPHIWDHDWNDHYAAISFTETVLIHADITLNMKNNEISSVEIIDIEKTENKMS